MEPIEKCSLFKMEMFFLLKFQNKQVITVIYIYIKYVYNQSIKAHPQVIGIKTKVACVFLIFSSASSG